MNKQHLVRWIRNFNCLVAGSFAQQFDLLADCRRGRRANEVGSMGPVPKAAMRPFGSDRKRIAGPDHDVGTRERRLGRRLQLQSRARRPVPRRGGLFAGRAGVL